MIELSGHRAGTRSVRGVDHFGVGFEDIPHRRPSLVRLRELIGWVPRTSLREGLEQTLDHWGLRAR